MSSDPDVKADPHPEADATRHAVLAAQIKDAVRDLGIQLALLNNGVSGRLGLRDVDLVCLNLIHRHAPISPSGLARHAGLHPATTTGILDRLERSGWVTRRRDPDDRRAVLVEPLRDRNRELFGLLAGMNRAMTELLGRYDPHQLELIADFLSRAAAAGHHATAELPDPPDR